MKKVMFVFFILLIDIGLLGWFENNSGVKYVATAIKKLKNKYDAINIGNSIFLDIKNLLYCTS
tara:strand:+ start:3610 stop:3798 length:189 start_codon:yes stop_codon:yes gene_type:complete